MNFLVFSPYYIPHMGGLENHAYEFNIQMAKRGHNITVFTPQIPLNAPRLDNTKKNITIIRFPAFEIIGGYPVPKFWSILFWKQLGEINKYSYDIVLSRTRFFLTSLMALCYAKIKHKKYIHIEHGSDFVQLDSRLASLIATLYDYTLGKLIFFSADAVIANSNASAEFVKNITDSYITPKIIYRGLEPSVIQNIEIPTKTSKSIILYAGRLIDGKGVQDLIQALKSIQEKQWVAWIIGDGPYKNILEVMVKDLNLEDRIIFLGERSHEDTVTLMSHVDIVVNPSYTEGLPTSVIEAARAGKAIIATNVGGTPEIITDTVTGLLYNPRDINALTAHLKFFLGSKEARTSYASKAERSMHNKFSWEVAMVQYEHVWNSR